MKRLSFISIIGLLAITTLVMACSVPTPTPSQPPTAPTTKTPTPQPTEQVIELSFSTVAPEMATVPQKIVLPWQQEVIAATNGRIKFKNFWSGSLLQMNALYDGLVSGVADISFILPSAASERLPLSTSGPLPLLFSSSKQSSRTNMALFDKYFKAEYKDVKFLYWMILGPTNLHTRKQQVRTMDDIKGLKLSLDTNSYVSKSVALAGASPIVQPSMEIVSSLQTGVTDGCFTDWASVSDFSFTDLTPYRTVGIDLGMKGGGSFCMNLKKFNSLPPDLRDIFEKVSCGMDRNIKVASIIDDQIEGEAMNKVLAQDKKAGNRPEPYVFPAVEREKWAKLVQPLHEDWIKWAESKGAPGRAFLNDVLAVREQSK